jgi:hypothetical protein
MLLGSGVLRRPLPLVAVYVRPVSVNTRRKGGSRRIGSPLQNAFVARGPPRVKADLTLMMSGGGGVGGLALWAEIFSRLGFFGDALGCVGRWFAFQNWDGGPTASCDFPALRRTESGRSGCQRLRVEGSVG